MSGAEPSDSTASTNTTEAVSTSTEAPKPQRRQSTLDEGTKQKLESQLKQRPERDELVDRNILKDGSVAPALQAARDLLERSRKEDKLSNALSNRPPPEDLVKGGILSPEENPTSPI